MPGKTRKTFSGYWQRNTGWNWILSRGENMKKIIFLVLFILFLPAVSNGEDIRELERKAYNSKNTYAQFRLGKIYLAQGKVDAGMALLKEACYSGEQEACKYLNQPNQANSTNSSSVENYRRGIEFRNKGDFENAITSFTLACNNNYISACEELKVLDRYKFQRTNRNGKINSQEIVKSNLGAEYKKEVDLALDYINKYNDYGTGIDMLNTACFRGNILACEIIKNSGTVDDLYCSYSTDYDENRSKNKNPQIDAAYNYSMEMVNDAMINNAVTPSGQLNPNPIDPLTAVVATGALAAKGIEKLAKMVDTDKITCKYRILGKTDVEAANYFENELIKGNIVPIFLLDGLISKFVERDSKNDIKRNINEFEFKVKTVKSNLNYFGFEYPKQKKIRLWRVSAKDNSFNPLKKYNWEELKKYF